ncbi:MAG: serine acetyltransferase [Bacteroidaceae bacterium]|nr:serine acetyltransferase [Prevotellaceae bacterium]MDY2849363.1 serine acetyltransferase [Bacteroidaceae bacterium]
MKQSSFARLLSDTVEKLSDYSSAEKRGFVYEYTDSDSIPSGKVLEEVVELCRSIFFPGFYGRSCINSDTLKYNIGVTVERLYILLKQQIAAGMSLNRNGENYSRADIKKRAETVALKTIAMLPDIKDTLITDVVAAYKGDPAATNYSEVISCYPVIKALTNYRLAHVLHKLGVPLVPRMLTEIAHSETGIDIHPGAEIGNHFTIDHGTGVVIGATCIIGNNVKLYQGVTLGAKSFPVDPNGMPIKGVPRHPIIEDDVVVYSNATILGRITIGRGAVIGGNIWVTEDVKPGAHLTQNKSIN